LESSEFINGNVHKPPTTVKYEFITKKVNCMHLFKNRVMKTWSMIFLINVISCLADILLETSAVPVKGTLWISTDDTCFPNSCTIHEICITATAFDVSHNRGHESISYISHSKHICQFCRAPLLTEYVAGSSFHFSQNYNSLYKGKT